MILENELHGITGNKTVNCGIWNGYNTGNRGNW